jgi:hypothetical protein
MKRWPRRYTQDKTYGGAICVRAPDHPPGAAYYAQTAGGKVGAPVSIVHFGEVLAIFVHRQG